ncbi:unnamed protein product [Polarella glacialis]|uniref:Uncharacterized protein n=1 Tax=Polarella glacialis TaxID=89957 RepID=A0A813JML6_POLGL|nr:unnamed protein product [Polarella glacialis]CAE8681902.1 unnamed protein product [Polarella glacialis]
MLKPILPSVKASLTIESSGMSFGIGLEVADARKAVEALTLLQQILEKVSARFPKHVKATGASTLSDVLMCFQVAKADAQDASNSDLETRPCPGTSKVISQLPVLEPDLSGYAGYQGVLSGSEGSEGSSDEDEEEPTSATNALPNLSGGGGGDCSRGRGRGRRGRGLDRGTGQPVIPSAVRVGMSLSSELEMCETERSMSSKSSCSMYSNASSMSSGTSFRRSRLRAGPGPAEPMPSMWEPSPPPRGLSQVQQLPTLQRSRVQAQAEQPESPKQPKSRLRESL